MLLRRACEAVAPSLRLPAALGGCDGSMMGCPAHGFLCGRCRCGQSSAIDVPGRLRGILNVFRPSASSVGSNWRRHRALRLPRGLEPTVNRPSLATRSHDDVKAMIGALYRPGRIDCCGARSKLIRHGSTGDNAMSDRIVVRIAEPFRPPLSAEVRFDGFSSSGEHELGCGKPNR